MAKRYRIIARVAELRHEPRKSPCQLYKLGQEFDLSKREEAVKICRWAFNSMFPFVAVLEFGGTFPWSTDPDRSFVACPDPDNVVVFELRRAGELKAK
jgi:uncharacterized repeat protein (TIGR04076 family)